MADIPAVFWLIQKMGDVPEHELWLSPGERSVLEELRFSKRRAEWRLGRWTAKNLVAAHLRNSGSVQQLSNIEIRAAEDGAPEVFLQDKPVALSLSISHSRGVGFCVIHPSRHPVGCDLEWIEPRSEAFVSDYFTAGERKLVKESSRERFPLLATLIWSAKESALKTLREGLRRDTRTVEVDLPREKDAQDWNPLTVRCTVTNRVFSGWWSKNNEYIRTVTTNIPLEKPPELLFLPNL